MHTYQETNFCRLWSSSLNYSLSVWSLTSLKEASNGCDVSESGVYFFPPKMLDFGRKWAIFHPFIPDPLFFLADPDPAILKIADPGGSGSGSEKLVSWVHCTPPFILSYVGSILTNTYFTVRLLWIILITWKWDKSQIF